MALWPALKKGRDKSTAPSPLPWVYMALGFILSPWAAALPWLVLLSLPLGLLLSLGLLLCLGWLVLLEVAAVPRVSASIFAGVNIGTLKAQTRAIVELVLWYCLHSW